MLLLSGQDFPSALAIRLLEGPMKKLAIAVVVISALTILAGCTGGRTVFAYSIPTAGNFSRGKTAIGRYGCGSCHAIPGIRSARGLVGPPLVFFGLRTYIAGEVPNNPENLVKWLRDPQSVEAGTAMPKLGLSDQDARDVAAYLYTLRSMSWNGGAE
jgi:cytochrome c